MTFFTGPAPERHNTSKPATLRTGAGFGEGPGVDQALPRASRGGFGWVGFLISWFRSLKNL